MHFEGWFFKKDINDEHRAKHHILLNTDLFNFFDEKLLAALWIIDIWKKVFIKTFNYLPQGVRWEIQSWVDKELPQIRILD